MKKIAYVAVAALAIVACNKEGGVKVETLTVTPAEKTVYPDELPPVLSLTATPDGALDGKTVEWESSDPKIVTVASDGTLAFAVTDLDEEEKTVTITAKVDDKTAICTLTVKEIISKYEVLDFAEEFGFKMLDRNIGAKTKEDTGNYYQWGKNAPVATTGDTEVNNNYDAEWGPESAGFADWTVAENTPCPKGWSLPDDKNFAKISEVSLNIIDTYETEFMMDDMGIFEGDFTYTKEQYNAAVALFKTLGLAPTGKFAYSTTVSAVVYATPAITTLWYGAQGVDKKTQAPKAKYIEDGEGTFPKITQGDFVLAMPVRCVKSTATPIL